MGCEIIFLQLWFRKAFVIHIDQFGKAKRGLRKFRKGKKGLQKFLQLCLLSVLQHTLLLAISQAYENFARLKGALRNCWMLDSFSNSLPCSLDWFGKGFKFFQDLDSSCFELQLALPWPEQSPPSFLAHLIDQTAI